MGCGSCSISAGLAAQTFRRGPWSELLIINWLVCWNVLGGALTWADLPAGTSCMVKDASVAVLSVGCFTKVLETKPPSAVGKVLSSSVLKRCRTLL